MVVMGGEGCGSGEGFWVCLQGWGAAGRDGFQFGFFFFFFYNLKIRKIRFFKKKNLKIIFFCHVSYIWQPRQHLTDQWMENVTVV